MASLPPKALHVLTALKQELLSTAARAEGRGASAAGLPLDATPPARRVASELAQERKAEVESRQRMRPARRSKASVASRYYRQRAWWMSQG